MNSNDLKLMKEFELLHKPFSFDFTIENDSWEQPKFKHSHLQTKFEGWLMGRMVWRPIESAPKGRHDVFLVGGETETPCVVVNTSESYPMHKDYPFCTYYGAHPLPRSKFKWWMPLPKNLLINNYG